MNPQKKTEIRVGVTVFTALILIVLVLGWAKNLRLGTKAGNLCIDFPEIAGLSVGDAVMVNGFKVGSVDEIRLLGQRVRVRCSMDSSPDLRQDATFSIMMLDLMGGKKIEIDPGISGIKMDFSRIQRGRFSGDVSTAMADVGSLRKDLSLTLSQLRGSLLEISDKKIKNELLSSIQNIGLLSKNLSSLVNENRRGFSSLIGGGLSLENHSERSLDSLEATLGQINRLAAKSETAIGRAEAFIDQTEHGGNNLGRVLYDRSLMEETIETLKKLRAAGDLLLRQMQNKGIKVDAHIF